jgi:CheY-like chemotaxis protein
MEELFGEVVKIFPDLLWFVLAVVLLAAFYRPIRHELLPNLANFKAGGVELSFVKDAMDDAIEVAEKSPQWHVEISSEAKERVLRRVRRNQARLDGGYMLWVDDEHDNNRNELRMFRRLGLEIRTVETTDIALTAMTNRHFDVLLSDIGRADDPQGGLKLLSVLQERGSGIPVIFYVGNFDPTLGVPSGAFGITNRPDELLHLVLDAFERIKD